MLEIFGTAMPSITDKRKHIFISWKVRLCQFDKSTLFSFHDRMNADDKDDYEYYDM